MIVLLYIVFVLGIVISAGSFGYLAYRAYVDKDKRKFAKNCALGTVLSLSFLVGTVFAPGGLFVIEAGEIGVVKHFGRPVATQTAGIGWRNPLTHSVVRYDLRVQRIDLPIETQTSDGQPFTAHATIYVAVQSENVLNIVERFGTLDVLLNNFSFVATDGVKAALVGDPAEGKTAMELIRQRAVLPAMIYDMVQPLGAEFYLHVRQAALPELQFSRAFIDEIERQMVAEQEILRAQFEAERALIEAAARLAVAELEKQVIVVKAEADAEALRIMMSVWEEELSDEVREFMLRQMALEVWDGRLPETLVGSDFLDALFGMFR